MRCIMSVAVILLQDEIKEFGQVVYTGGWG